MVQFPNIKFMGERFTPLQNDLTQLVHHKKVKSGEWITAYHMQPRIKPFEQFPTRLNRMLRVGRSVVDPTPGWKEEAILYTNPPDAAFPNFSVIMHATGAPPMTTKWGGQQEINLPRVLLKGIEKTMQVDKVKGGSWGDAYHVSFPPNFARDPSSPPGDKGPLINLIIVSPFRFFDASGKRVVGNDPTRFELTLSGIPEEVVEAGDVVLIALQQGRILKSGQPVIIFSQPVPDSPEE